MSGYPYGNPGGGYPPQQPPYGGYNNNYQSPPPPMPNYNDNQSCASLYGAPASSDPYSGMGGGSNYPPAAPYDPYAGNPMPNPSYGMGGGSNYPPPPQQSYGGQTAYPPSSAPPPQQFPGRIDMKFNSTIYLMY